MRRVVLETQGGPDVLAVAPAETPVPGRYDALVAVAAAGVNVVDLFQRSGAYRVELPFTPGLEGAGTVLAVGAGVDTVRVGDRVAWAAPTGAYATHCLVPAQRLVPVPDELDLATAAAVLVQGMTAHLLAHDAVALSPGQSCLVHAAAGGVGRLLTQYASARGATVIGTVSDPAKAAAAYDAGARHVVDYAGADFVAQVKEFTDGVDVVFDGVGRDTFPAGLGCLRPRGTLVLFGQTSGAPGPFDPQELHARGSVYLTKAALGAYDPTREQVLRRAGAVFGDVLAGRLRPHVHAQHPLADAATAHRELESRRTVGKLLLRP